MKKHRVIYSTIYNDDLSLGSINYYSKHAFSLFYLVDYQFVDSIYLKLKEKKKMNQLCPSLQELMNCANCFFFCYITDFACWFDLFYK